MTDNPTTNQKIKELTDIWQQYLATVVNWQEFIEDIDPKEGGCGLVYELPNPIDRPNESFAIADMRHLDISEPHKHIHGEAEVYIVLQGSGKLAVGSESYNLAPGVAVVTPPDTIHCILPEKDLVIAVVNTPPFNTKNYVPVDKNDPAVVKMLLQLRA